MRGACSMGPRTHLNHNAITRAVMYAGANISLILPVTSHAICIIDSHSHILSCAILAAVRSMSHSASTISRFFDEHEHRAVGNVSEMFSVSIPGDDDSIPHSRGLAQHSRCDMFGRFVTQDDKQSTLRLHHIQPIVPNYKRDVHNPQTQRLASYSSRPSTSSPSSSARRLMPPRLGGSMSEAVRLRLARRSTPLGTTIHQLVRTAMDDARGSCGDAMSPRAGLCQGSWQQTAGGERNPRQAEVHSRGPTREPTLETLRAHRPRGRAPRLRSGPCSANRWPDPQTAPHTWHARAT